MVLHYSQEKYLKKINILEEYTEKLKLHLDILEGYKDEITDFWNDAGGKKAKEAIGLSIDHVNSALSQISAVRDVYREAVRELGKTRAVTDITLTEALKILELL